MSSGASAAYAKPRSAESICSEESPRSSSTAWTRGRPPGSVGQHVGQLVVDGLDEGDAVAVRGEPLAGDGQRLRVAVEPDQVGLGARLEQRGRVAGEPEGAVDEHRVGRRGGGRERGGEQREDLGEHDRDVPRGPGARPVRPRPPRPRSAPSAPLDPSAVLVRRGLDRPGRSARRTCRAVPTRGLVATWHRGSGARAPASGLKPLGTSCVRSCCAAGAAGLRCCWSCWCCSVLRVVLARLRGEVLRRPGRPRRPGRRTPTPCSPRTPARPPRPRSPRG